jgi:hypothetical protein
MITVVNLKTGQEIGYDDTHTPCTALMTAVLQMEDHNYNTWDYPTIYPALSKKIQTGKWSISLGNWCTLKPRN